MNLHILRKWWNISIAKGFSQKIQQFGRTLLLPIAFAFFSGEKSVPIITMGIMTIIGLVIPFIWEAAVNILTKLSVVFLSPSGPFLTAAGERLFIPFRLHHLWNALFRFTEAGGSYVINGETFGGVPTLNEVLFNQGPNSQYWSMMKL